MPDDYIRKLLAEDDGDDPAFRFDPEPHFDHHHSGHVEETSGGGDASGHSGSTSHAPAEAAHAPAGEAIPVIDGATGEVVGTAHVDPQTGIHTIDGSETMVITETVSGGDGAVVGGGSDIAGVVDPPATEKPPVAPPDDGAEPDMGYVPRGIVPPEAFRFHRIAANAQETDCVMIVFVRRIAGSWVQFRVGVRVSAPILLRDGRPLTQAEAQIESAEAATSTAQMMADALDAGAIIPTQVDALFAPRMDEIMRTHGMGYRVQRCFPG